MPINAEGRGGGVPVDNLLGLLVVALVVRNDAAYFLWQFDWLFSMFVVIPFVEVVIYLLVMWE